NPGFAFVAAVTKAQSLDPKKIADALHTVEFDNLWGKAHFGGKDFYGIGNQIIYSMPFSEVKDGVATLVAQLTPPYNCQRRASRQDATELSFGGMNAKGGRGRTQPSYALAAGHDGSIAETASPLFGYSS